MKKLNKRLFRMIKNTKGQYIALLSIVITGIFIFTAVKNSALNLNNTVNDYYEKSNFADLFVTAANIPDKLENDLVGKHDIKVAEGRLVFDTSFITDNDNEKVNVRIVSVDKEENKLNKLFIRQGKRILSEGDIILIDQFATARNIEIGDKVTLQINGKQYKFNVSAIASNPEYVYMMENEQTMLPDPENFGVVFIEENYLRSIAGKSGFNEIVIKLNSEESIEETSEFLKEQLKKYGVNRVIKKEEQLSNSMLHEEISGLEMMAGSLPIVFLCFAGIMLASMLSRIVKKDRTSIGILKAMGFMDIEIIMHYTKYAASIGIIGGIVGSLLGTALSGGMTTYYLEFFNIPMLTVKLYPLRIVISVLLSFLFCIIFGFYGVRTILKINPAESMKPEAPKTGKRIILENIKYIWNKMPFSWKIVFRNIFREKKRFLFIAASVAITCSMMIMTFWMNDIIDVLFNKHYSDFMKMDYNISFDNFHDKSIIKEINSYIDSKDTEGRIEIPFELEMGKLSKVVNIIGIETDTVFYNFKDLKNNKVELPKEGILISSNLADSLNIDIGDKILLNNLLPEKGDGYVTVKGIVKQSLGINGYMNIDYLNNKFLGKNIVSGVYLNSKDDVLNKLENIKGISSIQSKEKMIGMFQEFTGLIAISIGAMIIFSGLLGFIIVYSMTLMSIDERTLEFSSFRVMGFLKFEIFYMIIKENMIMTIIGIIAGIPLGAWLVEYMGNAFSTDIYTMKEPLSIMGVITAIIFTILFIIFAQLITYAKIQKLDFIQALKNRIS